MALDKVTTAVITDDSVTGAKIENNPTVAGNLTVAGNTTLSGTSTLTGNATASGNLTVTGDVIPSAPLSHRNLIINGGMQIAQRQTSLSLSGGGLNGYWTCDRYGVSHSNVDQMVLTQEKSTVSPDGFSSSLKHTVTTAESAIAADEYFRIYQRIEGQDLQQLAYGSSGAKTFTLSFWVRSSVTGTYGVSCYQYDGSLQQTHNYTITTADTWQKIELPFTGNTANAIANDNTAGLQFLWYLLVGDNIKGTASTTWSAYAQGKSAGLATAVWGTSTSHDFYLTGVQMELGSNATPFEHRSYGDELRRCERYYQKLAEKTASSSTMPFGVATYYVSHQLYGQLWFRTEMRAEPTLANTTGSDYYKAYSNNSNDAFNGISMQNTGLGSVMWWFGTDISGTSGHSAWCRCQNNGALIAVVAEL